ncbi:MAG: hypothetical protein ABI693_22745 [Bryobacteraceae bacterium]
MTALVLAVLPGLFWTQPPETADALRKAGITEIGAPAANVAAWAGSGIKAVAIDMAHVVKVTEPSVDYKIASAGATSAPWINSNLWLFLRKPDSVYVCETVKREAIPLALGEAYAAGVHAYFAVKPEDLDSFSTALGFLKSVDGPALHGRANIAVVDDGSDAVGEVMNLLSRRNLLFAPVKAPAAGFDVTVQLGKDPYAGKVAEDPYLTAGEARSRLGDARRLVRVYGSETTIARLEGDGGHMRLHLMHFGDYKVEGLRVRVRGAYKRVVVRAMGKPEQEVEDRADEKDAVEFSVPVIENYLMVDLFPAASR